jgi:hypothetical protein
MQFTPKGMRAVRGLLTCLIVLNLAAALLCLAVMAGSFHPRIIAAIAQHHQARPIFSLLLAVRLAMGIGILMIPPAHVLLTRLRAIVATVEAGDPFVAGNAGRLTTIAWSLLAIQLLDLCFGAISLALEPTFGWNFALTGWLAVILLFVLARVFAHGARMREELEGTV